MGAELVPLVDGQFFYHAEGALSLWGRVRLSLSVPLLVYAQGGRGQLDELGGVADVPVASTDGSGLGDAPLPAQVMFVPGSLQIVDGPSPGPLTDAADADRVGSTWALRPRSWCACVRSARQSQIRQPTS